jgi:N-acetylglucosaminyl-diphospho-decaprenol L-rhamnosyltransferase
MGPAVLIVIVNYRTSGLAIDCLHSIAKEAIDSPGLRVVVVDNHSGDGSVEKLRDAIAEQRWSRWAALLPSDRNGGFAAGNNLAIREELARPPQDRARYIYLLNPDTVLRAGALAELLAFLEAHPKVGVAGSRIEDAQGRGSGSARRLPNPLGELESMARLGPVSRLLRRHAVPMVDGADPLACDWVSGAAMMIRTEVFSTVGLFDEGYFLYFEETDFCRRLRSAGWEIWLVPRSRVLHWEGASTRIRNGNARRAKYWYESRRRFFIRAHGVRGWILADCCWAAGRLIWTLQKLSGLVACWDDDPQGFASDLLGGDWELIRTGKWRVIAEGPPVFSGSDRDGRQRA